MSATHTPGPWTVGQTPAGSTYCWLSVIGADDQPVCHLCRNVGDVNAIGGGESGANARLIAAAPELLAALRGFHPSVIEAQGGPARAWEYAKHVIAKAEGRS